MGLSDDIAIQSVTYTGSGGGNSIAQGWECPRCHRILSPFTNECPCYLDGSLTNVDPINPYGGIFKGVLDLLRDSKADAPPDNWQIYGGGNVCGEV